jgi:hypothetical protein
LAITTLGYVGFMTFYGYITLRLYHAGRRTTAYALVAGMPTRLA